MRRRAMTQLRKRIGQLTRKVKSLDTWRDVAKPRIQDNKQDIASHETRIEALETP